MRAIAIAMMLSLPGISLAAQEGTPEPRISRDPAPAQPVGKLHTIRTIPEACARLQGEFTGDPAQPYAFSAVRTSASCRARARLVDATQAGVSVASGWRLDDRIRIPSAACPSLAAVVEVWRQEIANAPERDGQGQARIYLREGIAKARAGKLAALPEYAAAMSLQGEPCE